MVRPYTPPLSLTYLKYASAPRATFPAIDASPLSGTLEPRWISVGLTPGVATGRAPADVAATTAVTAQRRKALIVTATYCTTVLLAVRAACGASRRRPLAGSA